MSVLMSWARSTLAGVEEAFGNHERWFDGILVGAVVLVLVAIAFLVLAA